MVDFKFIMSSDLDGGVVVARNALEYSGLLRWNIRSRFALEARDGRFRIEQTNIERYNDQINPGWGPIGKWAGAQWKGADAAFASFATQVAQCVMN